MAPGAKSFTPKPCQKLRVLVSDVPAVVLCLVCAFVSPQTFGTELKAATTRAFQQYVDLTEARIRVADSNRFLQIDSLSDAQKAAPCSWLRDGEIFIQSITTKGKWGSHRTTACAGTLWFPSG